MMITTQTSYRGGEERQFMVIVLLKISNNLNYQVSFFKRRRIRGDCRQLLIWVSVLRGVWCGEGCGSNVRGSHELSWILFPLRAAWLTSSLSKTELVSAQNSYITVNTCICILVKVSFMLRIALTWLGCYIIGITLKFLLGHWVIFSK